MSLSSIIISGTLKDDPQKRFTPTNIAVTNLNLQVCYIPRGALAQNGLASQTIRVNAWRELAEYCEQNLKAGDKVLVMGRAMINAFTTNDGKKKRVLEIDANSIVLLNDVINLKVPVQKEAQMQEGKSNKKESFKQSENMPEEISNVDEIVNAEEIPF